ncbi:RNA pseudouridine synthase [Desulfovibrio mangrovi]|uniref:pseudouridine synthase family protein n=1 Tax=Desulfovibrio mangrovi TaxID=2976983 RepID=UPI0022478D25|nr:RNA pseudouridine synthase [Desulfovibrio mangrovi]UZP65964.1 RNA pseudouridine synthase [Desulfovibrio mangrovi]
MPQNRYTPPAANGHTLDLQDTQDTSMQQPVLPDGIRSAVVPDALHGQRLDAALALFLPDSGIRQRRRLFDTHTILVNGAPKSKGYCVSRGDSILLVPLTESTADRATSDGNAVPPTGSDEDYRRHALQVRIVQRQDSFAAIFKPGGMHTAHIAGGPENSLETMLPELFPGNESTATPILVNRLDRLTSGMVIVAFGQDNANTFKQLEDGGEVEKLYLAVVHGELTTPLNVQAALDMAKRKTTRVLATPAEDPLRHTAVLPLGRVSVDNVDTTCTLVLASIRKGARHQIRAHLAHAGYPIVGDPLYGHAEQSYGTAHPLYLHHYHIEFGAFSATCPPPSEWRQWESWRNQGLLLPQNTSS